MKLLNRTRHDVALSLQLEKAEGFYSRLKGLLGRKPDDFERGAALWIGSCNSVHTWFMRFSIDVVFVDKNLRVRRVYQDLSPWRVTRIVLGATSVFELPAGTLQERPVQIGDQLYVGD